MVLDEEYTQRLNDERGGQFWESIRENGSTQRAQGSIAWCRRLDTISLGGGGGRLSSFLYQALGLLTIPIETSGSGWFCYQKATIIAGASTYAVNDAMSRLDS